MSLFPRTESGRIDYKSMWEFKLLRGIFKTLVYLLFFVYVLIGLQSSWSWGRLKYYGGDFTVPDLVIAAEKLTKTDNRLLFIEVLLRYPLEKTDDIVEALMPLTPGFGPAYFFTIGNRYYLADNFDRAVFWTFLGRFRQRYDAVRCRHNDADDISNLFVQIYSQAELQDKIKALTPAVRAAYLREVLDWDEEHPPENHPRYFCNFLEKIDRKNDVELLPKKEWDDARRIMRAAATAYIEENLDE